LREFADLHDVNRQVRQWLVEVANQRLHRETRERPIERFQSEALRALPIIPYDHRDTVEALVHKDLRLQFDGNKYCVPHRYVGQRLTVKADSSSVTIYERVNEVFLLQDRDTQRVYRLYDFSKAQRMQPDVAYCIAGKVNSADKLYLVIESVRLDAKHARCSNPPSPADGAGGSATA